MLTEKLNALERATIDDAMGDLFSDVMTARDVLADTLGTYFEFAKQPSLCEAQAREIGARLKLINDTLWRVETEYSLMMGHDTAPATEWALEAAKRALLVRRVEWLRGKLPCTETEPYSQLSDEDALPALLELARRKGIREECED